MDQIEAEVLVETIGFELGGLVGWVIDKDVQLAELADTVAAMQEDNAKCLLVCAIAALAYERAEDNG